MRDLASRPAWFGGLFIALCAVVSLVIHLLLSWSFSPNDGSLRSPPAARKILQIPDREIPELVIPPEPQERLEFEEDFALDPPDILIAPTALIPPPPDQLVSLRSQAAGFEADVLPIGEGPMRMADTIGYGGTSSGIGNGLGDGKSQFGAYIESLRETGFDIVFVIDATGSMGWVIAEVKNRISDIAIFIRSLVPIARFGFVAYRDNDDLEFVTKVFPLTYSTAKLQRFLGQLKAQGGGDWHEEIGAGIRAAIESSGWRAGARKLIIVIGDAPMRQGQRPQVLQRIENFRQSRGMVSALDVSEQANPHLVELKRGHKVKRSLYRNRPMKDFLAISRAGDGDAATLEQDVALTQRLVHLIIGDKFAKEIQGLFNALED